MQRTLLSVAVGTTAILLVLGALGGCAAPTTGGNQATSNSGSVSHPPATLKSKTPTPSPTPTGPAPLPANALFRIFATVTAGNGATADLVQTVYKPIPQDTADVALLNTQCNYPGQPAFEGQPNWQTTVPNALLLTTDMTATLRPGSPTFDNKADAVLFGFVSNSAYSGQYGIFEAYCDSGYIQIPGTIHGVGPISSTDPVHGVYSWAGSLAQSGGYGFSGGGNAPGAPDVGGTAVVKNCSVQVSTYAIAADPAVAAWKTTTPPFDIGCTYVP